VIAMLHYAWLKSRRDSSLFAFILIPALFPLAALGGATLAKGHWHYPFFLNPQYTPVQNATLCAQIAVALSVLFTVIPAFWTLRPEIATRSVTSFFFAARPMTVAASVIVFAFALSFTGWIGAIAMIRILTGTLPPHVAFMTLKVAVGCLATSALGTLLVTISSQPALLVGAYMVCALLIPWIEGSKSSLHVMGGVAAAIVCTALAGFILERRCAT
jgi:hypothetical protein